MEKRKFKQLGKDISLLGFGCMRLPKLNNEKQDIDYVAAQELIDYAIKNGVNYFDTAYIYHSGCSENFIGKALAKYPRDSYYLADKLPMWLIRKKEDIERIFNEQLKKCRVDYFDFYLAHCLNKEALETFNRLDVYEFLMEKKRQGIIKSLGFSFHDVPEILQQIVDSYKWDFAQVQINYIDWEDIKANRLYEILKVKGIPIIIMEPVRGGALATLSEGSANILKEARPNDSVASWAIRFAASFPEVLTVLSGMSNMEQVADNIKTISNFQPLSKDEYDILEKAKLVYRMSRTIPCTGCRYCMDCPEGVDIPRVFAIYNQFKTSNDPMDLMNAYFSLSEKEKPNNCISCQMCISHCPQSLEIPKLLKEIDGLAKSMNN